MKNLMDTKEIYITESAQKTRTLGKNLAQKSKPGDFLVFYGNLGSGKTTFIQGLASGFGIKRRIISPTFIIVRQYKLKKGNFYHIDLYRTETINDLLGLGIDQIINQKENIVALEWGEKMGKLMPAKRIEIKFTYLDQNKREIKITRYE